MSTSETETSTISESERATISLDTGIDVAANIWPGDKTPIILAHGGGQTQHSWGATARVLADHGHRVITYDLRGHGDSSWAGDGSYDHSDYAADAVALVQWCGEPVIWIGASLGGMSGLSAIDIVPQSFAALVLVDITHRPAVGGATRVLDFMRADVEHGFESLEAAADAVAAYQPQRKRPSSTDGLRKNLRLGEDGRWRWHWDPAFLDSRPRDLDRGDRWEGIDEACQRISAPTLLVRGQLSDLVTDTEVEEFLKVVPHAKYVNVADAAHMIAGDKNDIFTTAVTGFVDEMDGSAD